MVELTQDQILGLFGPMPEPENKVVEQKPEDKVAEQKPEDKVVDKKPEENKENEEIENLKREIGRLQKQFANSNLDPEEEAKPVSRAELKVLLKQNTANLEIERIKETDPIAAFLGPDVDAYIASHPSIFAEDDGRVIVQTIYKEAKKNYLDRQKKLGFVQLNDEGLEVLESKLLERSKKRSEAAKASAKVTDNKSGGDTGKENDDGDSDETRLIKELIDAKPKFIIE